MKQLIFIIFILSLPALEIQAHPHVYIDLCIEFEISDSGISGFRENWTILRKFGENIGIHYDINNDREYDKTETEKIKSELFDNIKKYNHYTYIDINDTTYFPGEVEDFSASRVGNTTVFSFFVPCRLAAEKISRTYELTVHDISRYVSFGLMYIDDPPGKKFDYNIEIARDGDYYSHSCDFGNAVIILSMQLNKEEDSAEVLNKAEATDRLLKLTRENISPSETISNPFLAGGIRIQDDNPNPFMSY